MTKNLFSVFPKYDDEERRKLNDDIKLSRKFFLEYGCNKRCNMHNGREVPANKAAELLYCTTDEIKIYTKCGILESDFGFIEPPHYLLYSWIEDFANDNRLFDAEGNISERTGYDSQWYYDNTVFNPSDANGVLVVTPKIVWIYGGFPNEQKYDVPLKGKIPRRYDQLICIKGEHHCHSMELGFRAQGYFLKPRQEDLLLINKYNLISKDETLSALLNNESIGDICHNIYKYKKTASG